MTTRRHPYHDNIVFEGLPDGTVRVSDRDSGLDGIFEATGTWCSGELKYADPQMILLVAELSSNAT